MNIGFSKRFGTAIISAVVLLSPSDLTGQGEVYLKLKSEGFQPIAIAIPPFLSSERPDISEQVRQILINDLDLSGFFMIMDEADFDSQPSKVFAFSVEHEVKQTNNSALLEASIELQGNSMSLKACLQELSEGHLIFNKNFEADVQFTRLLAHQVADEVMYYLIGERGVANTKIAYVIDKQGAKEIALMDYDGYGFRQLTFSGSLNLSPSWSPDGEQIAFTSYVTGNPDLLLLNLNDGKASKLSKQKGLHSAPAWSPDGKKIALTTTYDGNPEIYTTDIKSGKMRRLTNNPAIDSSPSWSPNRREIAFTSDRSGSPQIYLMDADGGNVRRLTFEGSYNDSPAWSPKGGLIAFVSREDGGFQIYTIDVNGENRRRISDGKGNNENPSWSPDGLRLAFASTRNGKWDLYMVNWDGSNLRQITKGGGNLSPKWSPRLKRKN